MLEDGMLGLSSQAVERIQQFESEQAVDSCTDEQPMSYLYTVMLDPILGKARPPQGQGTEQPVQPVEGPSAEPWRCLAAATCPQTVSPHPSGLPLLAAAAAAAAASCVCTLYH